MRRIGMGIYTDIVSFYFSRGETSRIGTRIRIGANLVRFPRGFKINIAIIFSKINIMSFKTYCINLDNDEKINIPKNVFFTHGNNKEKQKFEDIIKYNEEHNKDLNFSFYDDIAIKQFIKNNYPDFFEIYKHIHSDYGAAKADIFRVLILYHYGGIYIDIKTKIKNIYRIVKDKPFCCGGYDNKTLRFYNSLVGFERSNFFLSTEKKGHIITEIKNEMFKRLTNYGNEIIPLKYNFLPGTNFNGMKCVYYYTGPGIFNDINPIVSKNITIIYNKDYLNYDTKFDVISNTVNYKTIYKNRYHISKNNFIEDTLYVKPEPTISFLFFLFLYKNYFYHIFWAFVFIILFYIVIRIFRYLKRRNIISF